MPNAEVIMEEEENIYEAETAGRSVNELFGGEFSVEQALQKLRTKLLDLSGRNRLLNYKFPKGRSIQFIDRPNLNLVYNRLIESKPLIVKSIPDPPTDSYTIKKPEIKPFAQTLGIDTETAFPPESSGDFSHMRTPKLQALYYPTDLDKLCRKIGSEARTVIEETGSNMLYLIFGFLEFYEREDSEKPTYAPLLAVPIALEKGAIDRNTRTYQYSIVYSGEDVHENQTLREKLSQDFLIQMPDFDDEQALDKYFDEIQFIVKNKKRWAIKYQLTLGFLSFGKLAIWADLDPKKYPRLVSHPLLNEIISGGSGEAAGLFPEDYDIDNHPQGDIPLIDNADSSQHSAIIDALAGKNMVINGPPGTGKSQTITNIIAAGLKAGKKILFVSEKLAALQVVRDRLNKANLGHFCLELHSHKTQKKKMLGDIQDRIDAYFVPPQQLQNKITTLTRHKKELNKYAELMSCQIGNELDLTVYEIFWRTEKHRQTVGDFANVVQSISVANSHKFSYDHIENYRTKLEVLGQLFTTIGDYNSTHPWWGFTPISLAPGDDETVGSIITAAYKQAEALFVAVSKFLESTNCQEENYYLAALEYLNKSLEALPAPPENIVGELLPRVFSASDPLGKLHKELLASVIKKVKQARTLDAKSDDVLVPNCELNFDTAEPVVKSISKELESAVFAIPIDNLDEFVTAAEQSIKHFKSIISDINYSFVPIYDDTLETFDAHIQSTNPLNLTDQLVHRICEGSTLLSGEVDRLGRAFQRVSTIASNRGINFDGSPEAIANLGSPDGIEDVLPGVIVDDDVIVRVQKASDYYLSDLSISSLSNKSLELFRQHDRINTALTEIGGDAQQLGFSFDSSQKTVTFLITLSKIASNAPADLLDFRHAAIAHPMTLEHMNAAESALNLEKAQRDKLAEDFYLDVLPTLETLKTAIRTFRNGDSLFNIFNSDWRAAKKQFNGISKSKIKLKAAEYEAKLAAIVEWQEHKERFVSNEDYKRAFGALFKGLDTEFSKIRRLHNWYLESLAELLKYPGFVDMVDLTTLDSRKVNQLAAQSGRSQTLATELENYHNESSQTLGNASGQIDLILYQSGWTEYSQKLHSIADEFKDINAFLGKFVKPDISPKRSLDLLNAKREIYAARGDFETLNRGTEDIREGVEPLLTGIATLKCTLWKGYLTELSKIAQASGKLGDFLKEFGEGKATPRKIRTFIEAKNALDTSVVEFSAIPERNLQENWEEYYSVALRRTKAARDLVTLLQPAALSGKTSTEAITGLTSRKKSIGIIEELKTDADVMEMLKNLFIGVDTDLDSLATTLAWGETVANDKIIRNSGLYPFLLNVNAENNFNYAKQQLSRIVSTFERLKDKLNEFKELGAYNWKSWNDIQTEKSKTLYAGNILERVTLAANNIDAILSWSKYNGERTACTKSGLEDFILCLEQKTIPPESIGSVYEFVIFRSIGNKIYKNYPELADFSGEKHEKKRSEFVSLDKAIIGLTGKSFAYEIDHTMSLPEGIASYKATERTEMNLLRKELSKQTKHIPIRQLLRRAGRAIQELKPCFMLGPLSVAQYLHQGSIEFDMIIMDEASQLRPEEALGAIARGKQLIVVGDPKQLPPTNFFDRLVDDGDENDESEAANVFAGTESILDICQQLFHPVRTLRWHYRSQHESLIAFSNFHFYNGKLVVFPSPFARNNRLGVRFRYIKNGVYKDRQNVPEAQRVADAVIEHMVKYPEESLGVVTLNQTQRDLIEDLLDKKIRNIDEAQTFISNWEEEGWPFFVKNLENVQGDERDIIFISTTFGKAPGTTKPRQNFGPISRPEGWKRLNVLFTRAKRKIELFTSMLPEDITYEEKTPAGTKALKDYLDFAKRGILATTKITGREADSDFEVSVGDMLTNRGYEVVPQFGVAGFFIDMVVRNPDRPGEFLAAIECDGATYHSSHSARDRDRIRQSILESLGWKDKIWRIWSTDWFYNPRKESQKLFSFLEDRRIISMDEPLDYEFEEAFEEETEVIIAEPVAEPDESPDLAYATSTDELFVEVGDLVTYCPADKPDDRHSVMIVDTESNPRLNLINENTPLALAFLNAAVGDEVELEVKGNANRLLRVLKIQRQERMFK